MTLCAQFQTVVSLVYPARCLNCGGLVESDFGLCSGCWSDTHFISGTACNSCGSPLPGDDDGQQLQCDACLREPRPWTQGCAAITYTGQGRRMVLALKHGDRTDLARPVAGWMLRAAQTLLTPDCLVVPVPLHWTRLLRRRYNQSALLAQALAERAGLAWCSDALLRTAKTPMLEGKTKLQRTEILGKAIAANPRALEKIQNRRIVLVDDVMTSGATLSACTQTCMDNGAKEVSIAVLARVMEQ